MIPGILIASLLATVTAAEPGQKGKDTPFARSYRALVDTYRDGRTGHAVEGVLGLDSDQLSELVKEYVGRVRNGFDGTLDADFFRAASALQVDAALRCWLDDQADAAALHVELGRLLVDASEPDDAGPGSFRRRWYAASALIVADHVPPPQALTYFEQAVERVRDDAPLLTAAGWFSERLSEGAAARGALLHTAERIRRRHQRTAERYFTEALEADARAEEASLRLARIESLIGREARADRRLTALLSRKDLQPFTAYLARLFLGEIRARQGQQPETARLYREAIALHPLAQSARLALAEMLYASGDAAAAADVVEPLATPVAGRERNDPWSDYQLAYPQVGLLILDELRDEVQR